MHLNTGQNRPTFSWCALGWAIFYFGFFFHSPAGHHLQQWVQRNEWNTGLTVIQLSVVDPGVSLS